MPTQDLTVEMAVYVHCLFLYTRGFMYFSWRKSDQYHCQLRTWLNHLQFLKMGSVRVVLWRAVRLYAWWKGGVTTRSTWIQCLLLQVHTKFTWNRHSEAVALRTVAGITSGTRAEELPATITEIQSPFTEAQANTSIITPVISTFQQDQYQHCSFYRRETEVLRLTGPCLVK